MKALLTKKIGMTSIINENGSVQAVTLLHVEPNTITQLKNDETDGYNAAQIGFGVNKKIGKSMAGHLKTSKSSAKTLREIRIINDEEELKIGDQLTADLFIVGDSVHVTSTSKGKGWAGTIKRHNFHRGRKTHGGRSYRRPGSIGSMYPQKIFKGKKMAGRMGGDRVTVRNLKVAVVDATNNLIGVTGAVPGPKKTLVIVKGA